MEIDRVCLFGEIVNGSEVAVAASATRVFVIRNVLGRTVVVFVVFVVACCLLWWLGVVVIHIILVTLFLLPSF